MLDFADLTHWSVDVAKETITLSFQRDVDDQVQDLVLNSAEVRAC
jgi:hypothetical protein